MAIPSSQHIRFPHLSDHSVASPALGNGPGSSLRLRPGLTAACSRWGSVGEHVCLRPSLRTVGNWVRSVPGSRCHESPLCPGEHFRSRHPTTRSRWQDRHHHCVPIPSFVQLEAIGRCGQENSRRVQAWNLPCRLSGRTKMPCGGPDALGLDVPS